MKRTTIAVAALLLAGCAAPAAAPEPAPTVTVTEQAPAPEPSPDIADQAALLGMELAWDSMDADTRTLMCEAFTVDPDWAWEQFSDGSEGEITRDVFDEFFEEKC